MGKPDTLTLHATDVSGQKVARASEVPADATIGEFIQAMLSEMNLPANDVSGRPLTYHALLEREGRHLHASESVGAALQEDDKVVLQPNIDAGLPR